MLQISNTTMQLLEAVFTLPEDLEDSCAVDRWSSWPRVCKLSLRRKRLGLQTEAEDDSSSFR